MKDDIKKALELTPINFSSEEKNEYAVESIRNDIVSGEVAGVIALWVVLFTRNPLHRINPLAVRLQHIIDTSKQQES